ncbi:MAG: pyruvate dehydrogenase complex dihydrolipoamide acetyltransferase [Rhizobiaceae bacterium]|nr:pyruvate dehydrogenase complex dihydrolipoamide acetyltransferase [Rhizobiaceae bacterium]
MAINITMPALSPTMEEGNLSKWLVKEGDSVSAGDVIAEIETDKATMEVEAVDEGVVAKLVVDAGTEGVKVNAVIAVLAEEGEDAGKIAKAPVTEVAAPAKKEVSPSKEETAAPTPSEKIVNPEIGKSEQKSDEKRLFASPLARRIAKSSGVDLSTIKGTGPHGRIVKRDVENVAATPVATAAAASIAPSDEQTMKMFEEGSYDLVPHDNLRKVIARRLVQSKQTIPHFYLTVECEIDALLEIRSQMNTAAPVENDTPAYKISVNDMIIKALALALRDVPDANVSWTESNMVVHKYCDVGVAVSIPGGLITPIVRKAEQKSLSSIANEMKDLAGRARTRKLMPQEYQGGSTAVSNLGMFGIREFSAVINPPQATILAVGAGEKRAVVRDGEIVMATMMSATLSTDHRAVDGVLGAQLLGAFKGYIESPVSMLV